jgi:hypothetical protein
MTPKGKSEIRISKPETKSRCLFAIAYCLLPLAFFCGCQPQMESLKPCPAKATPADAIAGLNARTSAMQGLRASGRCTIEYYDEDGKKRRESFPVIIRTMPPQGLYFQGNLIIPKGLILGTNSEAFWLWIKLKEVDSFWSGPISGCSETPALLLSPASVLESLGYMRLEPENPGGYAMKHEGAYDVLTMLDDSGALARRVYVYSCDSTPRKIEYYGSGNKLVMTTMLQYYRPVAEAGFAVPTQIEMTVTREKDRPQKLSITLNKDTLEAFEPSEKQAAVLFASPDPSGTKHIYKLNSGCRFEETTARQ